MSSATPGPGPVLGGRYRLEERLQTNPDGALWRATDSTLDRRVSVRVMRPGHPFAADVADAARRAALIDDSRLVRVLDVGQDGDVGFVVSEYLDGDSLATLVERSPLAAPLVRRIVGEVAQGLDVAAARGLHHLRLTPRSVIVSRDGTVKISGTAVEAAAAGLEPDHAATASRVDALSLIALLYSGLTGRWPLGDAGFPPAPRGEGGSPVPPADLVPGVPNDLDTLCVVTLGPHDDGPASPAEVARELAPWPSAEEAPLRPTPRRPPPDPAPAKPGPALPLKGKGRPAANPTAATPGAKPPAASPRRSATLFSTPSVAATDSLSIPNDPADDGPRRMDSLFTQQTVYPDDGAARTTPMPAGPPGPSGAPDSSGAPGSNGSPGLNGSAGSNGSTGAAKAKQARPGRGGPGQERPGQDTQPGQNTRPGQNTQQPGQNGRPGPNQATEPTRQGPSTRTTPAGRVRPPVRPVGGANGRPGTPSAGAGSAAARNAPAGKGPAGLPPLVPWTDSSTPPSRLESTGPFPMVIPAESPPSEQSRLVIVSITAALVLVLLIAAFSLRNFGGSGGGPAPSSPGPLPSANALPATSAPAVVPSLTPAPSPSGTPTPSPTPSASVPVAVAAIRAIDPEGDGDENTADSPLAVDGDPSTFWKSSTYDNAEFGGLKHGIGLALKIKKSAPVSLAKITVIGSGGTVELRTSDSADFTGSNVVGKASFKNGKATIHVDHAVKSKYIILWFTKLPSVDGQFRAQVSEVLLK